MNTNKQQEKNPLKPTPVQRPMAPTQAAQESRQMAQRIVNAPLNGNQGFNLMR